VPKTCEKIDDRMAGDRESEFCLALARVVDADFESAQVSRIAVSEAIQDWLSCCERKYAKTG